MVTILMEVFRVACIVYRTDAAGRTYAYSSESIWNPEKKQPRAKRTYLGRVNPETGEIIKGRQDGKNYKPNRKTKSDPASAEEVARLQSELNAKNEEILALKENIRHLQAQVKKMSTAFQRIVQTASTATS